MEYWPKLMWGLGSLKPRVWGISPCCMANTTLIKLTTPEAESKWPMEDLTEPMPQKPFFISKTTECFGHSFNFYRIAQQRTRTVGFDVRNSFGGLHHY